MDCTICANESSRGRGFSASLWLAVFGSVGRLGERAGSGLRGQPPRRRWFLRFVEEPDVILFHKNSGRGMPPNPRTTVARHLHGRGAPEPDHLMAHAGRAATASRSAVESAPRPGFRSSIIRREDVEFLGRKPETGGTPTPPGVEFVRYRRSHGLGFHETAAKTPRMAVRAVFRARQGMEEP